MNKIQFNLTNLPNNHCLAVYTDNNTRLIERALIVSPILIDNRDNRASIIVLIENNQIYKSISLSKVTDIIVTAHKWIEPERIENSQRRGIS